MTDSEIKAYADDVIRAACAARGIAVSRILLFGSRALGQARSDSDWDFLVEVDHDLPFPQKAALATDIRRRLAERHIASDLVFKTPDRIAAEQGNVGFLAHYALRDGVAL